MDARALFVCLVIIAVFATARGYTCFGVESLDARVCSSSRGACTAQDTCSCYSGFTGAACNETTCGWAGLDSFGAPQPTVSATVDSSNNVIIEVKVARRKNVRHLIGLQNSPSCVSAMAVDDAITNLPDLYFARKSQDTCYDTYHYNRTLQYFINQYDNSIVEKTYANDGSDTFSAKSTISINYLDYGVQNTTCQQTSFSVPFVINIYLQGVATISFENTQEAIGSIRQEYIRVSTDGKLQMKLNILLNTRGSLSDLIFASSAPDATINLGASKVSTSTYQLAGNTYKSYGIEVTSAAVHLDYSGTFTFTANLTRYVNDDEAGQIEQQIKVALSFSLQYSLPVPPLDPIVNNVTISTELQLYDKNYVTKKTTFSELDEMWVLSQIREKITVPNRKLAVRNAYICCMKNREQMPTYDPATNKLGCTANDNSIMSFWSALVLNQVPQTGNSFNTKIQALSFLDDKAGFSIDLLPLYTDPQTNIYQRLCYLHVESFLQAKTRSALESSQNSQILAFSPLQLLPKQKTTPTPDVKSAASASSWSLFTILAALTISSLFALLL